MPCLLRTGCREVLRRQSGWITDSGRPEKRVGFSCPDRLALRVRPGRPKSRRSGRYPLMETASGGAPCARFSRFHHGAAPPNTATHHPGERRRICWLSKVIRRKTLIL